MIYAYICVYFLIGIIFAAYTLVLNNKYYAPLRLSFTDYLIDIGIPLFLWPIIIIIRTTEMLSRWNRNR